MKSRYGIIILSIILTFVSIENSIAGWIPEIHISEPGTFYNPQMTVQGDIVHVLKDRQVPSDAMTYRRSLDNGNTWESDILFSDSLTTAESYNPSMINFAESLYISWINHDRHGSTRANISFKSSEDNGESWTQEIEILNNDCEIITSQAIGLTESFVYVIYCQEIEGLKHFLITKSYDRGHIWNDPHEIFNANELGYLKTIAANNTIHLVWSGEIQPIDTWQIYYTMSRDGGNTWSENYSIRNTEISLGSQPSINVNIRGDVIVCWKDFRHSPFGITGDIYYRISTDDGNSWGNEIQLTYTHKSMESSVVWVDDTIYVAYEDWRFENREIFYQKSIDNGFSWSEEEQLTDNYYDSRDPCLAVNNDEVFIVWSNVTDFPDTSIGAGVYFSRYDSDVGVVGYEDSVINNPPIIKAFPNPFNSTMVFNYLNLKGSDINIYDITGRLVRSLDCGGGMEGKITWDATDASGEQVSSGIYFARAATPQGFMSIKLLYVR